MTHPGPSDALWLAGATFLLVLVLAGTLIPLYAALFFRPKPGEPVTRLEVWTVRFGHGLMILAMILVGSFGVGLALMVMKKVWGVA